jgi:hypothetical protein
MRIGRSRAGTVSYYGYDAGEVVQIRRRGQSRQEHQRRKKTRETGILPQNNFTTCGRAALLFGARERHVGQSSA